MKHRSMLFLVALLVAMPAAAQVQVLGQLPGVERAGARAEADEGPQPLHVTDWLMQRPEGQEALAAYRQMKARGLLPAPAKQAAPALGEERDFRVFNLRTSEYDTIQFMLMAESERFLIWVEVAELGNEYMSQATIDAIFNDLATETPQGSYDPGQGIIVNDEAIFGAPPDADGDGKTDVLLLDVRDNYDPDNNVNLFVAGFVTPGDLPGGGGNNRDVLYLDTRPSLTSPSLGLSFVAQTAAHEYQHLIHLTYDTGEESFINEGLSEWAEVINGYPGRRIRYLGSVSRYNVGFFRFLDTGDLDDRQRGLRFISYLSEQFGVLEAGSLTRQPSSGAAGLTEFLTGINAGTTLAELLSSFHIANFINDLDLDPRYGYTDAVQASVVAAPSASFDGRFDSETLATSELLQSGGVRYLVWDQVRDLAVAFNVVTDPSNLRLFAFLFHDGIVETRALSLGATTFNGEFDRVAVVAVHVNTAIGAFNLDYAATWTFEQQFQLETTAYDDGFVPSENNRFEAFRLGDGSRQANRFARPPTGILTSVAVGPYFDHDFGGSMAPPDAPRDFRLTIWADNGAGRPGDELFALNVTDTRGSSGESGNFGRIIFQNVDLAPFQDQLDDLPDTFYLGLTNTGTDVNYLVMGVTDYTGNTDEASAVSFLYLSSFNNGQGAWAAFHNLTSGGESILQNRVLPIRASFLVPLEPVAVEDDDEVPGGVVLYPNFPNPFNPTTTIRYALPQAAPVRLTVFDLLGREVATLVDGLQTAGEHRVRVDASAWSSGLYLYTVEAAGERQTQRMMLVK